MALRRTAHAALGTDGFPADMLVERQMLKRIGGEAGETDRDLDARCLGGFELARQLFEDPGEGVPECGDTDAWLRRHADTVRDHFEVDGRVVCHQGELVTGDVHAIRAEAQREAGRLWGRLPAEL
jgi:hypothetical protein